jgi:hypothetical protein
MELIKAICIDNETEEYRNYKSELTQGKIIGLTKDKEYEVKQSELFDNYYEVENDFGVLRTYKKSRFKIVEDKKLREKSCLNSDCRANDKKGKCTDKGWEDITNCDGRIQTQSICYRFGCAANDTTGLCMNNILCSDAIKEPTTLDYEKEFWELKTENENLKNKNAILTQDNYSFKELAEGRGEYNEKLEKELNSKDAYWENYLTEIKTEYDCLLIKLEKAINTLSSENEQLKKTNEIIPVMKTEIDYLISENKKLKENGNDKFKVIIKKLCEVISLYN